MGRRFSRQNEYSSPAAEITVREDAPSGLRSGLVYAAYESGLSPKELRTIVCKTLRVAPDPDNWSEYPNVDDEVRKYLMSCEWFYVYDVIEEVANALSEYDRRTFTDEMNDHFREKGIGWQHVDGRIEMRGTETFEAPVRGALEALADGGHTTAQSELREALADLSRRPEADVTGAVQHACAALECLAREIAGDPKSTLGTIISKNPDLLPKPLDQAINKMWGYASERGRHLRQGDLPPFEDAELIVGTVGAVCTYMTKKVNENGMKRVNQGGALPW